MLETLESVLLLSTNVLDLFDMSLLINERFFKRCIVSFQALHLVAQVVDAPGIGVVPLRWWLRGIQFFKLLNTSISSRELFSMQGNPLDHLLDLSRNLASILPPFVFSVLHTLALGFQVGLLILLVSLHLHISCGKLVSMHLHSILQFHYLNP